MEEIKKFYMPYSEERDEPYFDGDGRAYIFADPGESLKEMCSSRRDIYSLCYAIGAAEIEDHVFEHGVVKNVRLTEKNKYVNKGYYNNRLNRDITKLLETREKTYLYDLKDCRFLVAARIKGANQLSYAVAKDSNDPDRYFYIAFSTINEFLLWQEAGNWKPVEVGFDALTSISRTHPYVVNPCGRRLVITPSLAEQITKGD